MYLALQEGQRYVSNIADIVCRNIGSSGLTLSFFSMGLRKMLTFRRLKFLIRVAAERPLV
jgi:hypothetical protein